MGIFIGLCKFHYMFCVFLEVSCFRIKDHKIYRSYCIRPARLPRSPSSISGSRSIRRSLFPLNRKSSRLQTVSNITNQSCKQNHLTKFPEYLSPHNEHSFQSPVLLPKGTSFDVLQIVHPEQLRTGMFGELHPQGMWLREILNAKYVLGKCCIADLSFLLV